MKYQVIIPKQAKKDREIFVEYSGKCFKYTVDKEATVYSFEVPDEYIWSTIKSESSFSVVIKFGEKQIRLVPEKL